MKVIRLSIAVIMLCCVGTLTLGQTLEAKLALKVDTFDSATGSIPLQLIEVAQRFDIPMGIEWSDASRDHVRAPVHLRATTVGSLLAWILAQQPGHEIRLDDGVVHVFATRLLDDQRNFLNVRLREFSLEKANMAAARFHLWGGNHVALASSGRLRRWVGRR